LTSKTDIGRTRHQRTAALSWLLAGVLLLAAGAAQALGLGQIQVKSQPGQPLLAEIPIITGDPSELEHLQVRLASPETFRRVGLEPPGAAAAGLQFTVALDARGRPVIRVTSSAPLSQPLLTFLLEVDWGQGRLVREYTALLDAPSTVAAPVQPIQAPVVAAPNTIERAPAPAPTQAPAPTPAPEATNALPFEPRVLAEPLPEAAPQPPPPAQAPAAPALAPAATPEVATPAPVAAEPAAEPTLASEDRYVVAAGDTLSEIAVGLDRQGHSLDQAMMALLRSNPEAFIGGNINLLRQGAVLRMPQSAELSRYSAGDAAAMVRTQVAQWREASAAAQPAVASGAAARPLAGDRAAAGHDVATASGEARLQIVPPDAGQGAAGTQTGIQAGGEGQMLRQQVQESQETLAARDAEVGELKARVAELEKLQQQQQQMIALKDSALAAAQQRLAANPASTQQAAQEPASDGSPMWPWLVLPLLVLLAAGAWWWWRRGASRRPLRFEPAAATPPRLRPLFSAPPVPEPAAPVVESRPEPTPVPMPEPVPAAPPEPAARARIEPVPDTARQETPTAPVAGTGADLTLEPASGSPPAAEPPAAAGPPPQPHWTAAPALVGAPPSTDRNTAAALAAGLEQPPTPARQVELARAYLDLGDDGAAREVLREVLDGRDPVARDIAARMLREL
jgi:pilus assembly protein FimV